MTSKPISSCLREVLLAGFVLVLTGGLAGASMLDPKGPVAEIERELLLTTLAVMMIVAVPVWIMAFCIARKYRASNPDGDYRPEWVSSRRIELVIWLVPTAIIVTLGVFVWIYSHKLDPYRSVEAYGEIDPSAEAVEVQVVAQDWKWLFIYPDHGIATVNELVFPAGAPLSLSLTSDTVMNSFFVPSLGSQIYAMAGMESHLNLLAWEPGRFTGRNSQFSGNGFPEQHFDVVAMTEADFATWVETVKGSELVLDEATYRLLAAPGAEHPVTHYGSYEAGLFDRIIESYISAMSHDVPAATD